MSEYIKLFVLKYMYSEHTGTDSCSIHHMLIPSFIQHT
jgi:hypothetical protein